MRLSFSPSIVALVMVEGWAVEGIPIKEPTQEKEDLVDPTANLQKRNGGSNSVLMTAVAAILIIILLVVLVVGGIYFLRKHTRSKVREIELKPSVSRAGNRDSDPSIRSSTTTSDDFSKELETPGISLQRTGTDPASTTYGLDTANRDEESSVGMSRDHLETLRYEATSPSPSMNSVNSTAPLVSGSEHHNAQPSSTAGHKRRTSRQQHRLSVQTNNVQTTFRSLMVEHSEGSPLSASTILEQFEERQAMRSPALKSPGLKSPLRSPGLYKTPRTQD